MVTRIWQYLRSPRAHIGMTNENLGRGCYCMLFYARLLYHLIKELLAWEGSHERNQ